MLYYLAENLAARESEFAARLEAMTGRDGTAEVNASVGALFDAAAWADKFDGAAKGVPLKGLALALREPVGRIGLICPDAAPLLGLIVPAAHALAMGNAVVAVASEPFPLAATDLIQVLETSDLPPGALNVLTPGHAAELASHLAGHADLQSVWCFRPDLAEAVERVAAADLKRTMTGPVDWNDPGAALLEAATEIKTVWVPYGENAG